MKTDKDSAGKWLSCLCLAFVLLTPRNGLADGCFVAPKFVWDKHKDINEPTQKAIIIYDAGQEDLILQVKYEGPTDEFGWLVPVPNLPEVKLGSMQCFYELSEFTQRHFEGPLVAYAYGAHSLDSGEQKEPSVKVIEVKTVGSYKIAILSTKDSSALANWLKANQYYFPPDKTGVLDSYIKQHWYFIAVKINLDGSLPDPQATAAKLASGELNPLQISFASDRCIFPLKISSVNGKPSEVQEYVLSTEPLMERDLYQLECAKSFVRAVDINRAQSGMASKWNDPYVGQYDPPAEPAKSITRKLLNFDVDLPYTQISKHDLPFCWEQVPRLKSGSWWLTKGTRTFKPEEMQDLIFVPAIPAFVEDLSGDYGFPSAMNLTKLGSDGTQALLAAVQSTNSVARISAVCAFASAYVQNASLAGFLPALLKDSDPEIRADALWLAIRQNNIDYASCYIALLRDECEEVRLRALQALRAYDTKQLNAVRLQYKSDLLGMLNDKNPDIQGIGLQLLADSPVKIPREDLLALFKVQRVTTIGTAWRQLGGNYSGITCDEAVPLLHNPLMFARLMGLKIMLQAAEKSSVELAIPMLKDPEPQVRERAEYLLTQLTGQHIPPEQYDHWEKWWSDNSANFVVHPHTEL